MSTSTVMKPLTIEERAAKGDEMASIVAQIDAIKAQAKSKAFEFKAAVDALHEQLVELANAMRFGLEETSQMSLFAGQAREAKGAREQLAEVARHACSCEGGPESEVHSPSCPVHGVTSAKPGAVLDEADAQLAAEVATATAETASDYSEPIPGNDSEESNVVDMAEALRAAEVNVGTVEEPGAAKAFRRGRKRA